MKRATFSLFLPFAVVGVMDARTWTSAGGRQIEAELIAYDHSYVTLQRKGEEGYITFKDDLLSGSDQRFLKDILIKQQKTEEAQKQAAERERIKNMEARKREIGSRRISRRRGMFSNVRL